MIGQRHLRLEAFTALVAESNNFVVVHHVNVALESMFSLLLLSTQVADKRGDDLLDAEVDRLVVDVQRVLATECLAAHWTRYALAHAAVKDVQTVDVFSQDFACHKLLTTETAFQAAVFSNVASFMFS